jgi:phage tail sheath protein FI
MAERIVSPGVFTREKDLSFLPEGIGEIGAALIGPTDMGPAFVPTTVRTLGEFEKVFGKENQDFYVPFTAKQYLKSAGTVTIVRVLHLGGYANDSLVLTVSGSQGHKVAAILKPSRGATDPAGVDLTGVGSASLSVPGGTKDSFVLNVDANQAGSTSAFTLSFDSSSANYITKVFSENPQDAKQPLYVYSNFQNTQNAAGASDIVKFSNTGSSVNVAESFSFDFKPATTPIIQSQLVNGARTSLFRVKTLAHGTNQNTKYRIGISNVKRAVDVAGSDYGSFSLQVIVNNPGQNDDGIILENYDSLSLDPDSDNYVVRRIGDRFITIDSDGKLTTNGDYPNESSFVRITGPTNTSVSTEASSLKDLETIPEELVPMGFAAPLQPNLIATPSASYSGSTADASMPSASYVGTTTGTGQKNERGTYDQNSYYGFDFNSVDSKQYLAPLPTSAAVGNNVTMSLEDSFGNDDASTLGTKYSAGDNQLSLSGSDHRQLKFAVPFQEGFDGSDPALENKSGTNIASTNTQGFDLSSASASGSVAYKRAINAVSNPDEYDINLLALPGVIHEYHSSVTNHAIDKVEDRADCFFILDGSRYGRTIQGAIDDVKTLDTNYVATYYPWVKILDENKNKPTWVPPSVILPGVYSNNDRIGQEWFAPAGLNRGGLTDVLEAQTRLTNLERDDLYDNRINPIATFPGQGVVVFGQKTLQGKPSALDRINVRRLLINLRKFIASSSRFLVFEQNTTALRNRFLNIVNPYLEEVQANSGLTAFRVVMDDSNNTPDVVDRNQLVGQIFIQPTRTAEFIVLDFVVQPTGAAFPE